MKTVKELSAIRSVVRRGDCNNLEDRNYAIGFASSDFIIWNLTAETKVLSCGRTPCRSICFSTLSPGLSGKVSFLSLFGSL